MGYYEAGRIIPLLVIVIEGRSIISQRSSVCHERQSDSRGKQS